VGESDELLHRSLDASTRSVSVHASHFAVRPLLTALGAAERTSCGTANGLAGRVAAGGSSSGTTFRGIYVAMDVGLFRDLVRLETELWNRVEVTTQQAHGVPLAWLEIMQVVAATEGCRVLDIARALSITVGGASKIVDKVEAAGLCRRNPNPTDGRSNLIQLTEPGVGLLAAADVTFLAALATFVGAGHQQMNLSRCQALCVGYASIC
jgi:DNA-binding MarR family transcriptional regulator